MSEELLNIVAAGSEREEGLWEASNWKKKQARIEETADIKLVMDLKDDCPRYWNGNLRERMLNEEMGRQAEELEARGLNSKEIQNQLFGHHDGYV